jgi:hypothetical protein
MGRIEIDCGCDISQKVEKINKEVKGSLSITHYLKWELSSYEVGTFFNVEEPFYKENDGNLKAETFEDLINKAYKLLFKK